VASGAADNVTSRAAQMPTGSKPLKLELEYAGS
jgi:hypothetical protein